MESVNVLKDRGNAAFKSGALGEALECYCAALREFEKESEGKEADEQRTQLACTLYSNRAACHLKRASSLASEEQNRALEACIDDCTLILNKLNPSFAKALYRRSSAYVQLSQLSLAQVDLKRLLQLEPKNAEALALMRQLRTKIEKEQLGKSEVQNCLQALPQADSTKRIEQLLKVLAGLCSDESSHAAELLRSGGLQAIKTALEAASSSSSSTSSDAAAAGSASTIVVVLTLLTSLANHGPFVDHVQIPCSSSSSSSSSRVEELAPGDDGVESKTLLAKDGRVRLEFICGYCGHSEPSVVQAAVCLVMRILKCAPLTRKVKTETAEAEPFLGEDAVKCIFDALSRSLSLEPPLPVDVYSLITDAISSLLSDLPDFITPLTPTDDRLETLEERKSRIARLTLIRNRVKSHAHWLVESGLFDVLIAHLDGSANNSDSELKSKRTAACFGRVIQALDSDDFVKAHLLRCRYIPDSGDSDTGTLPPVEQCRLRAALTAALYIPVPDLGSWALSQPQGVRQLLLLIATNDMRCQDVAAEVMCLAAANDSGSSHLAPMLETGALKTLLQSPNSSTRAAAASTMTKLTIKAKALTEESPEIAQILNTAFDVLKMAVNNSSNNSNSTGGVGVGASTAGPVSFSVFDVTAATSTSSQTSAEKLTSPPTTVERAVEIIASLIGRTHIKEEVVHGSYRLAPSIQTLVSVPNIDERSTAAYGVAHILASITVTNNELRAKALAEKDMTVEQYEQLAELQRIKTRDEKTGEVIEEKKEESDRDTESMCLLRIKRVVASGNNTIPLLVRLLSKGSARTMEAAARALKQICVDESVRGLMIQQGGLKACCAAAVDESLANDCRREAAHAVAKTLVTTNPNLLSEHARVGAIQPLLFLCQDTDSGNLQQFEALLALTNLLSCGSPEQDKFCSQRGVSSVHYLIFSEHRMVRRAATEVFCNIPLHEKVLKLLRQPDKVRLWLGLCEDWDFDGAGNEAILTARAAAGTLAVAVEDEQVCEALVQEQCSRTLLKLFESEHPELIHRALVWIGGLAASGDKAKKYLVDNNLIPALIVVSRIVNNDNLAQMARDTAQTLSESTISSI